MRFIMTPRWTKRSNIYTALFLCQELIAPKRVRLRCCLGVGGRYNKQCHRSAVKCAFESLMLSRLILRGGPA